MTDHADRDDFVCAVCRRNVEMRWNFGKGRDRIIPPICRYCEGGGHTPRVTPPSAGAFRDRREVVRGLILAEALNGEALRQMWSVQYG